MINILLILAAVWFLYTRFAPTKGLRNLSAGQFEKELKSEPNKLLLDVREPHEFKAGRIPGAVNIPLAQLNGGMRDIPKDKPVYVYCRSGMRSKQAARLLKKQGFTTLSQLQGGIMAWDGQIRKP